MENTKSLLTVKADEPKKAVLVLPVTDIEVTDYGSVYVGRGIERQNIFYQIEKLLGKGNFENVRLEICITQLDDEEKVFSTFRTETTEEVSK